MGNENFNFDVTPVTIKLEKILYGQASPEEFINLQHGTVSDVKVHQGEEVILLLYKTRWGD